MSARPKPELVKLEWLDIASQSGWMSVRDAREFKPIRCVDVGWVLHRDEHSLTLFRSRNSDGSIGDVAVFPTGCIVRVTQLEAKAARPPKEGAQ